MVLDGHVTAPDKRTGIAHRVAAIDGVTGVQNELDVLPPSRFDNDLRYQIARSIYGSPNFWHYAARRNPPIHIIVEHGPVTLTGVVDTEADRALAGILASNSAAIRLISHLQLSSEVVPTIERPD